jgi:hypothetical protein
MKMFNALILVFAVDFALYLFLGTTSPSTALFEFMYNPSATGLWDSVKILLAAGAIAMVSFGYISKSENAPYYAIASLFIAFGYSLFNLWNAVASVSNFCGGEAICTSLGCSCLGSRVIATIFVSPMILYYVMVCIEFARGRD